MASVSEVPKLSEICLGSIRKNFNKFIDAYEHSDDVQIKRSLLFLQKKFSSHFLKIFSNQYAPTPYYLEKTYFNFLLNKYLRELDTSIFLEEDWEVALHYLKHIGESFEKVTFKCRDPPVGHDELDLGEPPLKRLKKLKESFLQNFVHVLLPYLKTLSSLTMHDSTGFTEETVKMICSTCKELKDLTFDGLCCITDEGLKSLCPDDQSKLNLKSLNLLTVYADFWPQDIRFEIGIAHLLQNMPSLEKIDYCRLPRNIHKMHVGDLLNNSLTKVRKYNLTSMEINFAENFLGGQEWDTEALERTLAIVPEVCPALKKLQLVSVVEEKHLLVMTKFPDLVDVSIESMRFPRRVYEMGCVDVDEFLRVSGKQLKVLTLIRCRVSMPLLLTTCSRLETLNLLHMKYTDSLDHPNLKPLCSLKDLFLRDFDASHPNAAKSLQMLLKCCPNLEKLQFYSGTFDQEVSGIVGSFCERAEYVWSLIFVFCNLDPGLLQHFVLTCKSLKRLVLHCCRGIAMRDIEALRNIVKASEVSIHFIPHSSVRGVQE